MDSDFESDFNSDLESDIESVWEPYYSNGGQELGDLELDNSGDGPLEVPGLNGIGLDAQRQHFAHCQFENEEEWSFQPRVMAREIAMIWMMESLTDRDNWHQEVFEDAGTAALEEAARELSDVISPRTWTWCLQELRLKAQRYKQAGRISVLDVGSSVCKSDILVSDSTRSKLHNEIEALRQHREFDGQIQEIIDPSLYPLIFGKTPILLHGGRISLLQTNATYDETELMPSPTLSFDRLPFDAVGGPLETGKVPSSSAEIEAHCLSYISQWLPFEVEFIGEDHGPRITSYINNAHPFHHPTLYQALEEILVPTIEAWNDVLLSIVTAHRQCGFVPTDLRWSIMTIPPFTKSLSVSRSL